MVEILNKDQADSSSSAEKQLVLKFNPAPGENRETIDDHIIHKQYLDNSVSLGAGQENLSVLPDNFRERHDLEQYFFTKDMIDKYITSLMMRFEDKENIEKKLCLICAPSLATAFYERHGIVVNCLDIDTRFANLPGFRYFDLQNPIAFLNEFELILIDPPFFYISLEQMATALSMLCKASSAVGGCKLMISFMVKDEARVKQAFHEFQLERTSLELEYATVGPNRW